MTTDTLVLGGGTAGAALAGLLAEASDERVLLVEAGPDYGPFDGGGWPRELVDAARLPCTHDWGYDSGDRLAGRRVAFERARVIGGCSAHNGCAEIWGSRADYDGWAALGNPGWGADDLLPLFRAMAARLRVRTPRDEEVTPFQRACLEAAVAADIPRTADLNDLDEDVGAGLSPVNIVDGVRWNTAFAFLDPVRAKGNLTVRGNALAERVTVERGRATGASIIVDGAAQHLAARRIVIAAGAYGSPSILLRSGIGDPAALRGLGIAPVQALPGVGANLHDHPAVVLRYAGTPALVRQMEAFEAARWMPEEQVIIKARTVGCRRAFDLHLYPVGGRVADGAEEWSWQIPVACMTPRSRGQLRLASADPAAAPIIDHGYLSDPDGADRRVLAEGVAFARLGMAAGPALRDLLGEEVWPGRGVGTSRETVGAAIDTAVVHYYHPVGTCRMGPDGDPGAVVDHRGGVHGIEGLYVADASIMPVVPRANTNMPALVVAARIAGWLKGT